MKAAAFICGCCGYDLAMHRVKGTSCPECGAAVAETFKRHHVIRKRLQAIDLALSAGLVFLVLQFALFVMVIVVPWPDLIFGMFFAGPMVAVGYATICIGVMIRRSQFHWAAAAGLLVWIAIAQTAFNALLLHIGP
jgi:hypothetical protein